MQRVRDRAINWFSQIRSH